MMRKESELLTEKFLNSSYDESATSESKKAYEKPTLAIIKFMFENDITAGSFQTGQGGDNDVGVGDDWWD